jgi:hypothetical protein
MDEAGLEKGFIPWSATRCWSKKNYEFDALKPLNSAGLAGCDREVYGADRPWKKGKWAEF